MPNKYPVAERPNPASAAKTVECARPLRAVIAIIVWVAVVYFVLPRTESASDLVQALAFGAVILSPLLINMTLLVRHHVDLDRHPVATRAF